MIPKIDKERIEIIESLIPPYHKYAYDWLYENRALDCNHCEIKDHIFDKNFTNETTDQEYADAFIEFIERRFSLKQIFKIYLKNKDAQHATL